MHGIENLPLENNCRHRLRSVTALRPANVKINFGDYNKIWRGQFLAINVIVWVRCARQGPIRRFYQLLVYDLIRYSLAGGAIFECEIISSAGEFAVRAEEHTSDLQ